MKAEYRKSFENSLEANEAARELRLASAVDGNETIDVWSVGNEHLFWVHVIFDGEIDPSGKLAATGYERVW